MENLSRACAAGANVCVRGLIVNGINAAEEHARKLGELARIVGAREFKLLRFHPYYSAKLASIGRNGESMGMEYVPPDDIMQRLEQIMRN